jgi:hypothetical protein
LHVVGAGRKAVWTYYTEGKYIPPAYRRWAHLLGADDRPARGRVNSGRAIWKFSTDAPIHSSPLVANELIFFGNEAGGFHALDFRGELKWRFQSKRAVIISDQQGDNLYISPLWTVFYSLDAKTAGRFEVPSWAKVLFPLPYLRMILYLSARQMDLFIVWMRAMQRKYGVPDRKQVRSSPTIYKDSVYCGSDGNHVLSRISHRSPTLEI